MKREENKKTFQDSWNKPLEVPPRMLTIGKKTKLVKNNPDSLIWESCAAPPTQRRFSGPAPSAEQTVCEKEP